MAREKMAEMLSFQGFVATVSTLDKPMVNRSLSGNVSYQGLTRGETNLNKSEAEAIGIEALNFLAADATRLVRFLDLSGLDPSSIRSAARDPGFLAGVLDYVNADEPLLTAFARDVGVDPGLVGKAQAALGGRHWERDTP